MKYFLLFALFSTSAAFAHKNHHAHRADGKPLKQELLSQVSQSYDNQVRAIFQQKCLDCHSGQTRYPWYHKLPFAKSLIDQDIREAREHIDFGEGFPFRGHGDPVSDLEEVARTIKENTMPPPRYWLMHPSARLTEEERTIILRWAEESLQLLKGK